MEHSFDVDIAKRYGIVGAVLLKNIHFWIEKNRANEKNFYEGNYWTYCSKKAFAKLFPYLNERQIDYALKKLIDAGVLITGNFNANRYDRTLWFSITQKGFAILQNCEMEKQEFVNQDCKIVKPIPDNNTDNKTNRYNVVEDDAVAVLEYLNKKAGTHFRPVESNLKFIKARLRKNKREDLISVIDKKVAEWLSDAKMRAYLRPETLFNATKFESYLNGLTVRRQNRDYVERAYGAEVEGLYDNLDEIKIE